MNNDTCTQEVDEKTVKEMIHYIYTGELTGEELDVKMVALVADKYNLHGMMDLMIFRMKEEILRMKISPTF